MAFWNPILMQELPGYAWDQQERGLFIRARCLSRAVQGWLLTLPVV